MQLTDVFDKPHTYCGITAPVALWISAGMEFQNYGDTYALKSKDFSGREAQLTDGDIMEARITTGDAGEKALVWLIAERRRQSEERARNLAAYELAKTQKQAGDDAIHAARIERQARELQCLANGIHRTAINASLK